MKLVLVNEGKDRLRLLCVETFNKDVFPDPSTCSVEESSDVIERYRLYRKWGKWYTSEWKCNINTGASTLLSRLNVVFSTRKIDKVISYVRRKSHRNLEYILEDLETILNDYIRYEKEKEYYNRFFYYDTNNFILTETKK